MSEARTVVTWEPGRIILHIDGKKVVMTPKKARGTADALTPVAWLPANITIDLGGWRELLPPEAKALARALRRAVCAEADARAGR